MKKYKAVKRRQRGFLRDNGTRRSCMRSDCKKLATHNAIRAQGMWLEVYYCPDHAQRAGLV